MKAIYTTTDRDKIANIQMELDKVSMDIWLYGQGYYEIKDDVVAHVPVTEAIERSRDGQVIRD